MDYIENVTRFDYVMREREVNVKCVFVYVCVRVNQNGGNRSEKYAGHQRVLREALTPRHS